jgi:hypothetical protein
MVVGGYWLSCGTIMLAIKPSLRKGFFGSAENVLKAGI